MESTEGLYTVANFSDIHVMNTKDDTEGILVSISFVPCSMQPVTNLKCASEEEMNLFYDNHALGMIVASNYIDMDEVKPADESLEKVHEFKFLHNFKTHKKGPVRYMSLNEIRTDLFDDRFDLLGFSEPKQVDYMNFDENILLVEEEFVGVLKIVINQSKKVTKQKRVVYNCFMMFGDVGGLYDFLRLALATIFGTFS